MVYSRMSFAGAARSILLVAFLANLSGAFVIWFYLTFIDTVPGEVTLIDVDNLGIFVLFVLGIPILGAAGTQWRLRSVAKWAHQLETGQARASEVPTTIAQGVLNWVSNSSGGTFIGWLMIAIIELLLGVIEPHSILGVILAGIVATAIVFFASDLIWRSRFPLFFPDGDLSHHNGFRLSVSGRLLIVVSLLAIVPLLMFLLSLDRTRTLLNPETDIAAVVDNLIALQTFILLVGLVVSLALGTLLAHAILDPLKRLEHALEHVEHRNFEIRLPVLSKDELGYLSERFNSMTEGLQRAQRLRQLFNLYASPEVVETAVERGAELGGELCYCTMLFCDVRDFTTLTEKIPPEKLIDLINRYMSAIVPQVTQNGGVITRFGGDSILAVFGSPLNPTQQHGSQAVRAALAMNAALTDFNRRQQANNEPEIRIGIGIATGNVIVGNVGGPERLEYTVMGDAANVAARLEEMTKDLQRRILITTPTYAALNADEQQGFEAIPQVPIRGKTQPVAVYALT